MWEGGGGSDIIVGLLGSIGPLKKSSVRHVDGCIKMSIFTFFLALDCC